jgi:hypothetical protein
MQFLSHLVGIPPVSRIGFLFENHLLIGDHLQLPFQSRVSKPGWDIRGPQMMETLKLSFNPVNADKWSNFGVPYSWRNTFTRPELQLSTPSLLVHCRSIA